MRIYHNCTNCNANIYLNNGDRNFCGDCLKQECDICTYCNLYTNKIVICDLCRYQCCRLCLHNHRCPEDYNDGICRCCHQYIEKCDCE